MTRKKFKTQEIQSEKFPKIFIGISTNHKEIGDKHEELRFKNEWLGLGDIIHQIEDNGYFYPPITNVEQNKQGEKGYLVHSALSFSETSVIPFDIDSAKCSMEDFIDKLDDDLLPTIAFKTRRNNEKKGEFRFRFLYLFREPFETREVYYSAYETIKEEIKRYTGGDFGKDEYAYGLDPNGKGRKGSCCKPIRTNKSSDIIVYGHYYSQIEFFVPIIFTDLDYEESDKIDRGLFSKGLYDRVMKCHKTDIPYSLIPFRDFSITRSEFHNGFAYVRGNYNFAEFIRKFEQMVDDDGKRVKNPITGKVCYKASKWSVGEHRHKKLRMDALIARFNDYAENGKCTLTGDELFMILYDEAHKWFEVTDKEGNDIITCKFLMETASEALSMNINDVIDMVIDYNRKWDQREKAKRQLCRIDYRYWNDNGMMYSKDEIKLLARHTAKFLMLLKLYNPNLSLKENVAELDKNLSVVVPPHSISVLSKFLGDCKAVDEYIRSDRTITEERLREILFSEEGLSVDCIPNFCEYVLKFLDESRYKSNLHSIIQHQSESYWDQVKSGNKAKPNNGRPRPKWQKAMSEDDYKLPLKELVEKVHSLYPDVKVGSIKTWKYRQEKRMCA